MTLLGKLAKTASFVIGTILAMSGALWLWIAASGEISPGPTFGYVAGTGFLLVAMPLLALPFNRRIAKILATCTLLIGSYGLLWFVFRPGEPLERSAFSQAAAIALVVLFTARVGLAWYRGRSRMVT